MDDLQQSNVHEIIADTRKSRIHIVYRFLASFSTALVISWFLGSIINNLHFVLVVTSSSGLLSVILLLRKKIPPSEIYFPVIILISQLAVAVLSILALLLDQSPLFFASSITGLLLLSGIDLTTGNHRTGFFFSIYGSPTLFTGLLIISFLSMLVLPFLFLAAVKAASALYLMIKNRNSYISGVRILRLMILLFAGFCLLTRVSYPDNIITFIFICGEFIEMTIYNYDSFIEGKPDANHIEFNS